MVTIDEVLNIKNNTDFENIALRLFQFQAKCCAPYAQYLDLIGVDPSSIKKCVDIPFLPIELFKTHKIYCGGDDINPELIFTSSGTTGMTQSMHYVKEASIYEKSFTKAFEQFYGHPSECSIYALLPGYLEREGSSLIYMIKHLIDNCSDGGFFLYNHAELLERIASRDRSKHCILFGVSFALLDMAEEYKVDFNDTVTVMETGGMKGRRRELPREELHELLQNSLGVSSIHSEYGMCECLSQSYSFGDGIFRSPKWMRIVLRDLHDPFTPIGNGVRGGVNIIDLANIYSCAFIQTHDMGVTYENDSFAIEGRIDSSDIRGCNLLIQ